MSDACPFPPGAQVTAYLRDSGGDEQTESIPQQEHEVRAYCAKHKLTLTQLFKDEAKSGTSTVGRDDFWRMIHHFHNGAGEQGIIIWRTNRFGRNINDSQYYKADLRRRGFIVHSIKDNIPEGSAGQLIEFALDWKDQVFIEQLSEDVKRGLRQFVEIYGCVPGRPPRGFMREPVNIGKRRDGTDHIGHRWVPDPTLTPLVQRAFEMRARGETIPKIIAATGLYKSVNTFTTFFNNRLYIGDLVFGDLTIPNYCEPLIDPQIWDEVQRIGRRRKLPASNIDHPRRIVSPFVLSGVVFCQECGSPMSGYSMHGYDYYVCARRKRRHDCNARRVPRAPLEAAILQQLTERLLSIDFLLKLQTEMQNAWQLHTQESDTTRRIVSKQLTGIQNKIRNITKAIADHGHSKALINQLNGLELQEADLHTQLARLNELTPPTHYTRPQMTELAAGIQRDLTDPNKTRVTLRGIVTRVIVRRTDDQITGVMYCNKVIGQVPPWGTEPKTLFELQIPVRKRKAPLYSH